jgi:hypothetical protein
MSGLKKRGPSKRLPKRGNGQGGYAERSAYDDAELKRHSERKKPR